ncbi:MAG TPA: pilus assembly protein TadG-related protein [Chloroflexota bacterium]|nr:pilus assembly protein TadG-related protein [Chloroflexota bacterium]
MIFQSHNDRRRERGQATIFIAVMASVLLMMMGLAVEGGRVLLEYRHMQAAADMAALVGAEDLPNASLAHTDACLYSQKNGFDNCASSGASITQVCVPPISKSPFSGFSYDNSTVTSCGQSNANWIEVQISKTLAIPIFNKSVTLFVHAIARNNPPTDRDYALAILDPTECQSLILSGASKGGLLIIGPAIINSTCKTSIQQNGTATNLACDGEWDNASTEANPGVATMDTNGNTVAPVFSAPGCWNSTNAGNDNPADYNSGAQQIKDPYASTSLPDPTKSTSVPAQWASLLTSSACSQTDSYGNTDSCQPEGSDSNAWVYEWGKAYNSAARDAGAWIRANALPTMNSCCYELFPGQYPAGIHTSTNGVTYLNPGVYTVEQSFDTGGTGGSNSGGTICVYGAPTCDMFLCSAGCTVPGTNPSATCGSDVFGTDPTSSNYKTNAATWYYYCSPWGEWDQDPCLGAGSSCTGTSSLSGLTTCTNPSSPPCARPVTTTPPTFTDGKTPLNGVTFYMYNSSSSGKGGMSSVGTQVGLAFPNACPGNGTATANSVPLNQGTTPPLTSGSASGQYSYSSASSYTGTTSVPVSDTWGSNNATKSSTGNSGAGGVYPDADLSVAEDTACTTFFEGAGQGLTTQPSIWTGEFCCNAAGNNYGQHLHFMFASRDPNSIVSLVGNGSQQWWGIFYNPCNPNQTWPNCAPGTGSTKGTTFSMSGTSGAGTGPPLVIGQIIVDSANVGGSYTAAVFFRPCTPTSSCSSGPGIHLVQ